MYRNARKENENCEYTTNEYQEKKEEKKEDLACGDLDAQTMHEEMKIR